MDSKGRFEGAPAVIAVASLDMVRQVVATERRHGSKLEVAIADAALALGFSPRWVRAVIRDEPAVIKPRLAATMRQRFQAWLAADIERTEKHIAQRRELLAEMENSHASAMASGQGDLFLVGNQTSGEAVK